MDKHENVLLYSGGLDSFIAYYFIRDVIARGRAPTTVYVDIGNKYGGFERLAVMDTFPDTIMMENLNLTLFEQGDANIPYRNPLLLLMAALAVPPKPNTHTTYRLICQEGEMSIPDRTPEFFDAMTALLREATPKGCHVLCSPTFRYMTKTEVVAWYLQTKPCEDYLERLLATRSCYAPTEKPCGKCTACFRRWVAFTLNHVHEEHVVHMDKFNPIMYDYAKRLRMTPIAERDDKRWIETEKALRKIKVIL